MTEGAGQPPYEFYAAPGKGRMMMALGLLAPPLVIWLFTLFFDIPAAWRYGLWLVIGGAMIVIGYRARRAAAQKPALRLTRKGVHFRTFMPVIGTRDFPWDELVSITLIDRGDSPLTVYRHKITCRLEYNMAYIFKENLQGDTAILKAAFETAIPDYQKEKFGVEEGKIYFSKKL